MKQYIGRSGFIPGVGKVKEGQTIDPIKYSKDAMKILKPMLIDIKPKAKE